jgi:hypothetical protein
MHYVPALATGFALPTGTAASCGLDEMRGLQVAAARSITRRPAVVVLAMIRTGQFGTPQG